MLSRRIIVEKKAQNKFLRFFVHSELAKECDIMGMPHPRSCHSPDSPPHHFPAEGELYLVAKVDVG
jgi:hypothetical protein